MCDTNSSFLPTLHLTLQGFHSRRLKESAQLCQAFFSCSAGILPASSLLYRKVFCKHSSCAPSCPRATQRTLQIQTLCATHTLLQCNQPAQDASDGKPRAVLGQRQVLQEGSGSPALPQQNTDFLICSRLICKFALRVHNSSSGFLTELQKYWKKAHSLLSSKRDVCISALH